MHIDAVEANDAELRVDDDPNSSDVGLAALLRGQLQVVVDLRDPARKSRSIVNLGIERLDREERRIFLLQSAFAISFLRNAKAPAKRLVGFGGLSSALKNAALSASLSSSVTLCASIVDRAAR